MALTIHYLRDLSDPASECWAIPFQSSADLAGTLVIARDGYADVRNYLGATGFRITDEDGSVVCEEYRPAAKL